MRQNRRIPLLHLSHQSNCQFAFVLLLFFSVAAGAQETGKIAGRVYQAGAGGADGRTEIEIPVGGATVLFCTEKDTIRTAVSPDGYFSQAGIPPGRIAVVAKKQGFDDQAVTIEVLPGDNILMLQMHRTAIVLAGATVTADTPPVTHRKDTVIFHTSAVRVMDGAEALEILRQMPGVEISRGKLRIYGKEVRRTYVNGTLVYGDDVMTPLHALLAEKVVEMKSYEELSVRDRRRGAKNARKERVLDIVTKEPIVKAFDGHITASGGIGERNAAKNSPRGYYAAGLSARFFSEKFLSAVELAANNNGEKDLLFHALGSMPGGQREYNDKISAKISAQKNWGDRLLGSMVSGEYSYGFDRITGFRRDVDDYYEDGDLARHYDESRTSLSSSGRHAAVLRADIHNDHIKSLTIRQAFQAGDNRRETGLTALSQSPDLANVLRNEQDLSDRRDWQLDGNVTWSDNRNPKGWFPSVSFSYSAGRGQEEGSRIDTLKSSSMRRFLTLDSDALHYSFEGRAMTDIYLINTDEVTLTGSVGYGICRFRKQNRQLGLDYSASPLPTRDPVNTFDYTWDGFEHGGMLAAELSWGEWNLNLDAGISFQTLKDVERLPADVSTSRLFIAPSASARLTRTPFALRYSLTSQIPSVEQIRDWTDDRNPLFLQRGNPDLLPSLTHSLSFDYMIPRLGKTGSVRLGIEAAFVGRNIVQQTWFSGGKTLQTWNNAEGTVSVHAHTDYMVRLQPLKTTLSLILSGRYDARPEFIGNLADLRREWQPSGQIFSSIPTGKRKCL